MARGEYRIEVRIEKGNEDWIPLIEADPVPDLEDMSTERSAQLLRNQVTKLNRQAGWYQYRTGYVYE